MSERAQLGNLSKDQVAEWLSVNGVRIYEVEFLSHELDGKAILGLIDLWAANKSEFLNYAQNSLGISAPGHALRFASLIEGVRFKDFDIPH